MFAAEISQVIIPRLRLRRTDSPRLGILDENIVSASLFLAAYAYTENAQSPAFTYYRDFLEDLIAYIEYTGEKEFQTAIVI